MKTNILFDLDGTLLDTTEGVIESAHYAAKELGYSALDYSTMLNFVGPPIQDSFIKYYGCTKEEAQKAAEIFRSYYKENALFKAAPYEDIYQLMEALKADNCNIGVATYKREDYALTILDYYKLSQYCCSMHGADNNNVLKKADIVDICLSELGGEKSNCVLIGDTVHDAKGAADAGVGFIAVTYGFGFKTEDDVNEYPCLGVAKTPLEVLDILKRG